MRWLWPSAMALLCGAGVWLSPPLARSTFGADCSDPPAVEPIPVLRAHVDFPLEYRATLNRRCGTLGRTSHWAKISAPAEFEIDGAGGLFYWIPAVPGPTTITIRVTETSPGGIQVSDDETFTVIVDDNTMSYPLFRDYLSQATTVPIEGRAHGADFVSYTVEYAAVAAEPEWVPIAGPITVPVAVTGELARWDIGDLPDGGRYIVRLTVQLTTGDMSVVENQVIIDRSAKPGWPQRVAAITHSVVLADLTGDGSKEVLILTHAGELHVWRIDGELFWETERQGAAYAAPSVGDIDGDGLPEIVWTTAWRLFIHRYDGSLLPGFPLQRPSTALEFRSTPTLADLDGDGRLDVVVTATARPPAGRAHVYAYRYDSAGGVLEVLPGWPRMIDNWSLGASASVGDLDGDGAPEVVVESLDRVYAWHSDGAPVATGLHRAPLAIPVAGATTNGGVAADSTAQPAIADLNGDGSPEIIVAANVLQVDGTSLPGWEGGKVDARPSLSAAVGDLDSDPNNGLEVVLGSHAWHASGAPARPPLPELLVSPVLGDCGDGDLDTVTGARSYTPPGAYGYHPDGEPLEGYPKSLFGHAEDLGAPVIGDFDADGLVDVAVAITDATYGGIIAVWDMGSPDHPLNHHWPMLGHDVRHTGALEPPCTTDAQCDDDNRCTIDACDPQRHVCRYRCDGSVACDVACGRTPLHTTTTTAGATSSTATTTTAMPTTTTVPARCEDELAGCAADWDACEGDLARCRSGAAIVDEDADGEADHTDRCPGTSRGRPVDAAGCSLEQFCAAIDVTTVRGKKTCRSRDWQNDEPFMRRRERDCWIDRGGLERGDERCRPVSD